MTARLPFDPVARAYRTLEPFKRRARSEQARVRLVWGRDDSVKTLAEHLGVSRRTVHRWQAKGIPEPFADRIAAEVLNVHPSQLWGDAWWALCDTRSASS